MNIDKPTNAPGQVQTPSLDDFSHAAANNPAVSLSLHGETWQVKGHGVMPGSQRSVVWVDPEDKAIDTTSAYCQTLSQSFSAPLAKAVAKELGLTPSPGKPMDSRDVIMGREIAETAQKSIDGANFFVKLQFTASTRGEEFKQACAHQGVDPAQLSSEALTQIDARMADRFTQASSQGVSVVSHADARQWLREIVQSFK